MSEPDFISQCGDPLTLEERREWFEKRADEAKANGAVCGRIAVHETIPNLILFEGWKVQPEDQGEVRWQLTSLPAAVGGGS